MKNISSFFSTLLLATSLAIFGFFTVGCYDEQYRYTNPIFVPNEYQSQFGEYFLNQMQPEWVLSENSESISHRIHFDVTDSNHQSKVGSLTVDLRLASALERRFFLFTRPMAKKFVTSELAKYPFVLNISYLRDTSTENRESYKSIETRALTRFLHSKDHRIFIELLDSAGFRLIEMVEDTRSDKPIGRVYLRDLSKEAIIEFQKSSSRIHLRQIDFLSPQRASSWIRHADVPINLILFDNSEAAENQFFASFLKTSESRLPRPEENVYLPDLRGELESPIWVGMLLRRLAIERAERTQAENCAKIFERQSFSLDGRQQRDIDMGGDFP